MGARGVALAVLLSLAAAPARAIELELQENREQRGNIGFVDMQRVFKAYPGTIRAKENFEDLVRQAEEQINLRKAEMLRARKELSELKSERELVAKTPIVISAPAPSILAEPSAATAASTAPATGGKPPSAISLPGLDKPQAVAAKPEPLVINIPGVSTAPIVVQPPSATAEVRPSSAAPAVVVNPALAELDAKIALKARDLSRLEADFADFQAAQEKSLLDLESRRTEIILGKISKAIQEVAHGEGISVVVDKSNIVFGHGAVDLTEKVLKHLEESK